MDNTVYYKFLVAAYKRAYQASGNLTTAQKVVESSESFERRPQQNYAGLFLLCTHTIRTRKRLNKKNN